MVIHHTDAYFFGKSTAILIAVGDSDIGSYMFVDRTLDDSGYVIVEYVALCRRKNIVFDFQNNAYMVMFPVGENPVIQNNVSRFRNKRFIVTSGTYYFLCISYVSPPQPWR